MKSSSVVFANPAPLYTRNFLLIWFANFFMNTSLGSFFLFPLFIRNHGGSEADMGILMGAFTISSLLGKPWISQAVDRFGRKRSFILGIVSFIILPLVHLLFDGNISNFFPALFAVRVVHGLGFAFCLTSSFTYVADIVPKERLNEGLGMFGVTGLIGIAIGPAISEPIISNFGFDLYFLTISILAICSLALLIPLPETLALNNQASQKVSFWEILKRKKILATGFVTICFGVGMATQSTFVAPFAQTLGIPNISVYFIAYSLAAVLSRVFGSKLADQVGEVKIIPGAMLLVGVGFLSLVLVDSSLLLMVAGFITGCGHGFLFPCLSSLINRDEPAHIRGKINGIFTGSMDSGLFLGSVGFGYVGEWFGYTPIFILTFLMLFSGMIFFLSFLKKIVQ